MIAGVLTANELALLRTRPQRTQLYLAIPEYHTIYTARTDGAPATNDKIISVAYDGGAGTIADVADGMTLLIGTSAGAWDVGIARIRDGTPLDFGGTGTIFIGVTSEIEWADNLYLTVVDDFSLWPRHPFVSAAVTFMDYDIAYTNQNVYGDPVPIMGSHAVLELTGATVTVNFDASDSYNCIGTPDHYDFAWYVDGVLVSNADNVDISFAAVGTYLIKLEVTADYDIGSPVIEKTSTAYRYVIVYDRENPLNSSFTLDSCDGDFESGGWSYRVTMNANAAEANVRDRTLCLLVAKDWYGDTQESIGPLEGRENIICAGWVDGESLRRSNDKSMVSFEVQGPSFWLGVQEGFPTGIDDTSVAPTDWNHINTLTPRKGLFSFLHWRTTATAVMDCYITSDDHRLATTYTPAGSLLEQLRAIAERVNARTVCDRYGRLFCEIDTQFITPVSRTFPVVQTLSDRDWRDEIGIERRDVAQVGQVDLSGIFYSGDLTTSNAIFSLSPGHIPKHYGDKRKVERIALDDQAEANLLAGLWLGYFNNEYPNVDTPMSSNYRAIDIAPRMFAQMNLAAPDTPRGIVWTNKKLIPRRVSFRYSTGEALLLTDITFEAEAFPSDAIVGDPPIEPPDPPDPPAPPTLCNDPDAINFGGFAPCIYPETLDLVVAMNQTQIAYSVDFFTAASPAWNSMVGNLVLAGNHYLTNFVVCPGGDGYCLTHHTTTPASCGCWYCADITASPPVWSLVVDEATMRTAVGSASATFQAITVDGSGVAWCKPTHQASTTTHHYYTGSGGAMAHASHIVAPAAADTGECQFSITQDCSAGVWAGFHGNYDAGGHVIDLTIGSASLHKFTLGVNNTRGVRACATTYAIGLSAPSGGGSVNLITNLDPNLFANALTVTGIMDDGGIFYLDATTRNLTNSNVTVAVDAGVGGVFATVGAAIGSGFWIAGSNKLWVASSAAALNDVCSIAYSSGGAWASKDGDWAAKLGAAWAGCGTVEAVIKAYSI